MSLKYEPSSEPLHISAGVLGFGEAEEEDERGQGEVGEERGRGTRRGTRKPPAGVFQVP